jgi:hypothetical protein
VQTGLEHDGQAGPPTTGHADDVARAQQRQRRGRFGPTGGRPGAGQLALPFRQQLPEVGVFGEVAPVAGHSRGQLGHGLAVLADLPGQSDDAAVGLELRERRLEQG